MKIASFSDTHLGPPHCDRFGQDEATLVHFTEYLSKTHEKIVLVGDIFQADCGSNLGPHPSEIEKTLRRYPRLWALWNHESFVLIHGNHDRATRDCLNAHESFTVTDSGITVHYVHGDQFDVTLKGRGPDVTMWTLGRLRSLGFRRASNWFEDVVLQNLNAFFNRGDPIARAACALGKQLNYHVIVGGHTHLAKCVRIDSMVYANSGATSSASMTYISVDTSAGTASLRRFNAATCKSEVLVSEQALSIACV